MKSFTSTRRALIATSAALAFTLTASAQTIPPCSVGGGGGLLPASGSGNGTYQGTLPTTPGVYTLAATATPGSTCVTSVTMRGLTHTWVGDVQWVLQDPSGNKYNLFCRPGAAPTSFFSCDYSGDYTIVNGCTGGLGMPAACSGVAVLAPGTYSQYSGGWTGGNGISNTNLSSIPAATGTWTLIGYDWAGGDTGTLTSWEICFGTPPPPSGAPTAAPVLNTPANGAIVSSPVTLTWGSVNCGAWYDVDVDGTLYSPIAGTSTMIALSPGTHTWMVRGANGVGNGPYSASRTFDILGPPPASVCVAGDLVGGPIPASGDGGVGAVWPGTLPATPFSSTASIATPAGSTKIVRLVLHGFTHTWVGDMQVVLTDPSGTQHNVLHRPGFTGTGFGCAGDPAGGDFSFYETYGPAIELGCPASIPAGNYEQGFGTGAGAWTSGTNSIFNTPLESIPVPSGSNNWTVTIYDWAGGDLGSCTGWDLCFDQVPVTVGDCQIAPTVSQTCDSVASFTGAPSATTGTFITTFSGLNTQANGVVFYGITGPNSAVWSPESLLCVKAPTQRLNGVSGAFGNSGGTPGNCDGSYSFDMNTIIQAPSGYLGVPMSPGTTVDMQAWVRDPASSKTTNLSDSLSFTVGP